MVHGTRDKETTAQISRWRLPGGPDAARETTPERRCHDVIVSTLPAATHRIFMDHRLVGCQDRGRGAGGGCYQQPGERVAVMHRQFGCATNVGALQAQTVQAQRAICCSIQCRGGSGRTILPAFHLRTISTAETSLTGTAESAASIASVAIAESRSGSVHNQMSRHGHSVTRKTMRIDARGIVRDRNFGSRHRCATGNGSTCARTLRLAGAGRPSSATRTTTAASTCGMIREAFALLPTRRADGGGESRCANDGVSRFRRLSSGGYRHAERPLDGRG